MCVFLKKKQYNCSKSKKKLLELQRRGVPEVTWKLTKDVKEELERIFPIIPCLCKIKTHGFYNIGKIKSQLLRDLYYARQNGIPSIVRRLTIADVNLLREKRISYKPINYRIVLR